MAKAPKKKTEVKEEKAEVVFGKEPGKKAILKRTPKEKEPRVNFARWFRSKGFKPHWEAGMRAYTNTEGRRPLLEWDRLFRDY